MISFIKTHSYFDCFFTKIIVNILPNILLLVGEYLDGNGYFLLMSFYWLILSSCMLWISYFTRTVKDGMTFREGLVITKNNLKTTFDNTNHFLKAMFYMNIVFYVIAIFGLLIYVIVMDNLLFDNFIHDIMPYVFTVANYYKLYE